MNRKKLRMIEICCLYYFIIRASFLGVTSSNIIHLARQDSWISIIVGTILGLIPLSIFLYVKNHYPDDTIFSITKKLFGTVIGKIINTILVIGISFIIIITFYNMIGFISSQYLHRTPTIAIGIMFILVIVYILTKGTYVFDNQHYNRNVIITYFLSSITLMLTTFFIISIFGPHLALLYQYPEYHLLKLINISGFISRVEGIIALHWLFDLFSFIVMGLYFIIKYIKDDFKMTDKITNYAIITLSIILLFAVEHIFKNNTIANFIILHYSPSICFGFLFFIPLIIFVRVLFKNKKVS